MGNECGAVQVAAYCIGTDTESHVQIHILSLPRILDTADQGYRFSTMSLIVLYARIVVSLVEILVCTLLLITVVERDAKTCTGLTAKYETHEQFQSHIGQMVSNCPPFYQFDLQTYAMRKRVVKRVGDSQNLW